MDNYFGRLKVPAIGITLEQLILILYPSFLVPAVYLWYAHLQKRKTEATTPRGCVKLGLKDPSKSHMSDQYDEKYDEGTDDQSRWKVKALHIHPIKSCAPVEMDEVEIEGSGITWDRKFAFAELLTQKGQAGGTKATQKWSVRTLRNPGFEKLALVKPEVWVPKTVPQEGSRNLRKIEQTGALIVKFPNIPTGPLAFLDRLFIKYGFLPEELSFQVPLMPSQTDVYPKEVVKIWEDDPVWLNLSIHVPDSFRTYIGAKHPLTLFRADPDQETYRKVFRNAPRKEELGYQVAIAFTDAYPLHILNLASVHDVGNRIKDSIPSFNARRFRSNILLTGPPAYDEDDWKKITVVSQHDDKQGKRHQFHCACHTVRCRLPNVDPETGQRHPSEPDKALKSFRCIDQGDEKNACLGLQLVASDMNSTGGKVTIRVGDGIVVDERGEHLYIRQGH